MRTTSLKAKCGRARFNPLVHHTCSGDLNSVYKVAFTVPTALNARRAGPDCFASRHEVVDEFREGFERIDLSGIAARFRTRSTPLLLRKMKTFSPAVIPPFAIVKPTEESS